MFDCPDLAVPIEIMRHVVHVESAHNPFAIGVVGGRLSRQPRQLGEALAAVRALKAQGFNFSVGIAQVNRYNLAKYGLNSYAESFEVCPNLQAGAEILKECYDRAQDWGKAFSCYYSGNFVTGFEHGYVQKVLDSMSRNQASDQSRSDIAVIARDRHVRRQPSRDDGVPLTAQESQADRRTLLAGIPTQIIGTQGNPYQVRVLATRKKPVSGAVHTAVEVPGRTAMAPERGGHLLLPASTTQTDARAGRPASTETRLKPGSDAVPATPADRSFVF
ncbi:MAG: lytic transglycosylase domain-containing protein [Burkholderiaceae bacterium]